MVAPFICVRYCSSGSLLLFALREKFTEFALQVAENSAGAMAARADIGFGSISQGFARFWERGNGNGNNPPSWEKRAGRGSASRGSGGFWRRGGGDNGNLNSKRVQTGAGQANCQFRYLLSDILTHPDTHVTTETFSDQISDSEDRLYTFIYRCVQSRRT